MSSDTIYSYYNVVFDTKTAVALDLLEPRWLSKLDYVCNLKGKICIQINRPPRGTQTDCKYTVAYSFCSPKDAFNKAKARAICNSRVRSNCYLTFKSDTPLHAKDLTERAIQMILDVSGTKKAKICGDGCPIKVPDWVSLSPKESIQPHFRKRKMKTGLGE